MAPSLRWETNARSAELGRVPTSLTVTASAGATPMSFIGYSDGTLRFLTADCGRGTNSSARRSPRSEKFGGGGFRSTVSFEPGGM